MTPIIILLLTLTSCESSSINLSPELKLDWEVDRERGEVVMMVEGVVKMMDWVGLGFSNHGDIEGADMCVVWTDWRGKTEISDVNVDKVRKMIFLKFISVLLKEGIISEDDHQDCKQFQWKHKYLGNGKVKIWFGFTRALSTCEPGDYSIEEGTTHVLWSVGGGPLYSVAGVNASAARDSGMVRLRLLTVDTPTLTRDTRQLRIRGNNVSLPSGQDTFYWCSVHKLPPALVHKHHVVRYEADIEEGNQDVVHHMEVFHCPDPGSEPFPVWSGSCDDPAAPPQLSQCKKVLAAWAIGAGPFSYPAEAGLAIGGPQFHPYVMLEVHYNNPQLRSGIVDSSGIKLHVTPKLRKYDAGIMELGLIYNNWMAIPPGMSHAVLTGVCVEQCTGEGLPRTGVTIFGSQLHTHGAGRRVETVLVRDGMETLVNQDRHYSTHFQEIRTLATPVHVMPGDALVTRCHYDTSDRDNVTLGGFGFREEMCVNYIHYYPRVDLEICKSSIAKQDLDNYFDTLRTDEDQDTDVCKTVEENYNSIKWTKKRTRDLSQVYADSHVALQCQSGTGDSLPGSWNSLEQPIITKPLVDIDPCKDEGTGDPDDNQREEVLEKLRNKRFKLNSFEDQWVDYDAWGVDKRSYHKKVEDSDDDVKEKRMDMMDHHHMGKKKLGSM